MLVSMPEPLMFLPDLVDQQQIKPFERPVGAAVFLAKTSSSFSRASIFVGGHGDILARFVVARFRRLPSARIRHARALLRPPADNLAEL